MLEISALDLDEIVMALQDQNGYEHFWLIDPATGEITFTSRDLDPDLDLDESDLIRIDPLPSRVWYLDMADFADEVSDERAGRRLARAIQGRGAFRRFKDELHDEYPHLLDLWYEFSGRRGVRRAVEWLADSSLVDTADANRFLASHPDIDISGMSRTARSASAAPFETQRWSNAELDALVAAATVDAYIDDEQLAGLHTALEEHLALPFTTEVLGVTVSVERIDLADDGRIVAMCERGGVRQPIGILDLPLPDPAPKGSQWIAAYRRWARDDPDDTGAGVRQVILEGGHISDSSSGVGWLSDAPVIVQCEEAADGAAAGECEQASVRSMLGDRGLNLRAHRPPVTHDVADESPGNAVV